MVHMRSRLPPKAKLYPGNWAVSVLSNPCAFTKRFSVPVGAPRSRRLAGSATLICLRVHDASASGYILRPAKDKQQFTLGRRKVVVVAASQASERSVNFLGHLSDRHPPAIEDAIGGLVQHQVVRAERQGLAADIRAVEHGRLALPHRTDLPTSAAFGISPVHASNDDLAPIDPAHIAVEDRLGRGLLLLALLRQPDLMPERAQAAGKRSIEIALRGSEQRTSEIDPHAAFRRNIETD